MNDYCIMLFMIFLYKRPQFCHRRVISRFVGNYSTPYFFAVLCAHTHTFFYLELYK